MTPTVPVARLSHDLARLFCLDLDGTVIRSFMREGGAAEAYDLVELLPGRFSTLHTLARPGTRFALVTNQGGVAFGYQTQAQVWAKMGKVLAELSGFWGCPATWHVSFGHPKAKVALYAEPEQVRRRKPSPVMIAEAMLAHGVPSDRTVMVGDMDVDAQAAESAGVTYYDAEEFFDG